MPHICTHRGDRGRRAIEVGRVKNSIKEREAMRVGPYIEWRSGHGINSPVPSLIVNEETIGAAMFAT